MEAKDILNSSLRRLNLTQYISTSQSVLASVDANLSNVIKDVSKTKVFLVAMQRNKHNLDIAKLVINCNDETEDLSVSQRLSCEKVLKDIEDYMKVIVAAKGLIVNKTDGTSQEDNSFLNNIPKSMNIIVRMFQEKNSDAWMDADIITMIYNYATICFYLGERSFAFKVYIKIFDSFERNKSSAGFRNFIKQRQGQTVCFSACFTLLDFILNTQSYFNVDEDDNGNVANVSYVSQMVASKGTPVILFLEELNSDSFGERTNAEFRFRVQMYKCKLQVLSHNSKQARKEVKIALEILQHDLKKLNSNIDYGCSVGIALKPVRKIELPLEEVDTDEFDRYNVEALCLKANVEFQMNNQKKSIKILQSGMRTGMSPFIFLNDMACICSSLSQTHTASMFMQQAVNVGGQNHLRTKDEIAKLLFNYGILLLRMDSNQSAYDNFKRCSSVMPNDPRTWLCLAGSIESEVERLLKEISREYFDLVHEKARNFNEQLLNSVNAAAFDLKSMQFELSKFQTETQKKIEKTIQDFTKRDSFSLQEGLEATVNCMHLLQLYVALPIEAQNLFEINLANPNEDFSLALTQIPSDVLSILESALCIRAELLLLIGDISGSLNCATRAMHLLTFEQHLVEENISLLNRTLGDSGLQLKMQQTDITGHSLLTRKDCIFASMVVMLRITSSDPKSTDLLINDYRAFRAKYRLVYNDFRSCVEDDHSFTEKLIMFQQSVKDGSIKSLITLAVTGTLAEGSIITSKA